MIDDIIILMFIPTADTTIPNGRPYIKIIFVNAPKMCVVQIIFYFLLREYIQNGRS